MEFDPDSLSFGEDLEEDVKKDPSLDSSTDAELSYNEIKDAHWFYDTPGIMKEHDVRLPIQTVLACDIIMFIITIISNILKSLSLCATKDFDQNVTSQVLSLLNEQEVKLLVPTQAITPRTFIMKPGMVLLLGALARIDYLEVRFHLTYENNI